MEEQPPRYAEVRDKMHEEDWSYIGGIQKRFPDAIYVYHASGIRDEFRLFGVAINEQCIPAILYLLENGATAQDHVPGQLPLVCSRSICWGEKGMEILDILARSYRFDPTFTYSLSDTKHNRVIEGVTPLHFMARKHWNDAGDRLQQIVEWLIARGVPLSARTSLGHTAHDYWIEYKFWRGGKFEIMESMLRPVSRLSKNAYST